MRSNKSLITDSLSLKIVDNCIDKGELNLDFNYPKNNKDKYRIDVNGFLDHVYFGNNFYEIFLNLRQEIETKHGFLLACNGSLKNFFVSGMTISFSEGLGGYLLDEVTLENNHSLVFQSVYPANYPDLMSISDQKNYRDNFLTKNKVRILERNMRIDEEAEKINKERGGVFSIKGFPKDLL